MREEAKQRLQTLNGKMEDILRKQHAEASSHHPSQQPQSTFLDASSFENVDLPRTAAAAAVVDHAKDSRANLIAVQDIPQTNTHSKETTTRPMMVAPPSHFTDSSLLHDTRWKVVIRVGSTRPAAALEEGDAEETEKPLLLHLEVDFTPETLVGSDDPLLQGSANAKILHVRESWIGASSMTEGRQRDVKIQSTGGWKVLPGQGPKGIDILRFYIDVDEEICHDPATSRLRCPATRVYCTMGVFPMEHHNESEAYKDYLRSELDRLVNKYEDLTLEDERDERLFSLEQVKRAKQMMDLRAQIKSTTNSITNARIRDPEKGLLRLSRKGDVGVTKEGQVCYRDTEGHSGEYLVLGKFEAASVGRPIVEQPKKKRTSTSNNELLP